MTEYFLCTTWKDGVQKLPVIKETAKQITLSSGRRLYKRSSETQFIGKTRDIAKDEYIKKLQKDQAKLQERLTMINDKIIEVANW